MKRQCAARISRWSRSPALSSFRSSSPRNDRHYSGVGRRGIFFGIAKLFFTLLVAIVLLLQMKLIAYVSVAAQRRASPAENCAEQRTLSSFMPASALLVLLVPVALSVFRLRGLNR